jgi:hypothetical protein
LHTKVRWEARQSGWPEVVFIESRLGSSANKAAPATVESPRNLANDLLNLNSVDLRNSAIAGSTHSSAHDANITLITPGTRKSQIPVVEEAITIPRWFGFLPGEQKQAFAELASQSMQGIKIC